MKILFLHEVGYFEKPIFEMHEFPEQLASLGHEIAFLDLCERKGSFRADTFGGLVNGRVEQNSVVRLFSQQMALPGIIGRLMAVFSFPRVMTKAIRNFQPDLVVSYAVPTSGWQALIICKLAGIPFVFRALDVSHRIRKTALFPLVKLAERFIYRNSSWVSCNNAAMRNYCLTLGAREGKSSVDLPPLDLAHFLRQNHVGKDLRDRLGIPQNAKIVLYMGSFFYFSGLDKVLQQLSKEEDKPQLVLIGGGEQEAKLKEMVAGLALGNFVTFTGYIEFDELPEYLSIADVAINPMLPSLVADTALPNKVLQYMASGLPVVSTDLKGLSSLFPSTEGLSLVSTPEEVLRRSISVVASPTRAQMGAANRRLVEVTFQKRKSLQAFEQLLTQVGSSK